MAGSEENHTGEKLVGKVKEGLGNLTGNDKLKAEGQTDQAKASAKQGVDDIKDAAHGVADSLRNEKH